MRDPLHFTPVPCDPDEVDDGIPDFTPVPVRARHDGWTPPRQRKFIELLTETGCIDHAARSVGMSKRTAYRLRERPGAESFCAAWDEALEIGQQILIDSAYERAINGIVSPVFYQGRQIGERRRYNDRLLIEALRSRAFRPEGREDPQGHESPEGHERPQGHEHHERHESEGRSQKVTDDFEAIYRGFRDFP